MYTEHQPSQEDELRAVPPHILIIPGFGNTAKAFTRLQTELELLGDTVSIARDCSMQSAHNALQSSERIDCVVGYSGGAVYAVRSLRELVEDEGIDPQSLPHKLLLVAPAGIVAQDDTATRFVRHTVESYLSDEQIRVHNQQQGAIGNMLRRPVTTVQSIKDITTADLREDVAFLLAHDFQIEMLALTEDEVFREEDIQSAGHNLQVKVHTESGRHGAFPVYPKRYAGILHEFARS